MQIIEPGYDPLNILYTSAQLLSVLAFIAYWRFKEPHSVLPKILSYISSTLFSVSFIFYVSVFYIVENSPEERLVSIKGKVDSVVTKNTGFDLYVSKHYFDIHENSFYCIGDISGLRIEEFITVSYLRLDILGFSYKCVRSIRKASL